ncbi:PAS domain-containing methyl-accepting chemotaxis protein [Geomonas sp. Red32]|uniref:methyl-accepting chemotaxis protein n=1 Tax=Geomonas sp. Red32 TaxID=2912856 RepID=UPI00202CE444|nr:PAS domain-containing methyl-accepting chemotaxis protein [Geomonas sp. Red32]MCM0081117.1 PAS domain-containing methyl-accepting chemotaxis protein [Geomonas sp. Red32]
MISFGSKAAMTYAGKERGRTAPGGAEAREDLASARGSLLDATLDPLIALTREGTIADVNEAAVKATGRPRQRLIGAAFATLYTEPALAGELFRQALQKGEVRDYPLTIRGANGTLTEVINNAAAYRGADGAVAGVVVTAHDVTESNRAVNELVESKRFLDNVLQSSTKYSIIGQDLQQRILSWNEGARRNYGYQPEEVIGKDSAMLYAPGEIESGAVDRLITEAHEKGIAEGEFTRIRKDGSRFVASVVLTRRNDSGGHPVGYLVMSHDITDKKQTEERLHESSRYARSLIEASLDSLVTVSPQGTITGVNEATTRMTGLGREELIGTDFSSYFTDSALAAKVHREVFEKGVVRDYSLTIRHRDGTLTDVLYNASVYRDDNGKVLGAFAAARDITERKKAGEELAKLNQALEQRIAERAAQNQEILEAARILAGSSSDIMAFMSQIASGVTETAVTVNETTSVVEEVKATAQFSSEKARKVAAVTQEAVAVAQSGRKAVDDSLAAMGRIQEQGALTGGAIMRLSEQSEAIGEIIATVQDLAEQSNLLAVNASIEAAKAGEQGMGFAVVAQELKSLAQQSKHATIQVRTILKEIEKASQEAIKAIEQGKEVVNAGVVQSKSGGEAIVRLEGIITDSAQSGQQIGASSEQQLAGMDHIAQAMQNIRQASTDNASGIKQIEISLQKLNELGQKLKRLVEQYQ